MSEIGVETAAIQDARRIEGCLQAAMQRVQRFRQWMKRADGFRANGPPQEATPVSTDASQTVGGMMKDSR